MLLALSSDGFFQKTQPPDVHLVSFQGKYAPLYIFRLAFRDVLTAMFMQLKIFCLDLGFFCRGFVMFVLFRFVFWGFLGGGGVNTTMRSTVFTEIASGNDSGLVSLQLLRVLTQVFFNSFGHFWFMKTWLNKETAAAESVCCSWGSTSPGSWRMLAPQQINLTVAKVIL